MNAVVANKILIFELILILKTSVPNQLLTFIYDMYMMYLGVS